MSDLTQAELKRLFHYNPETGIFSKRIIKDKSKYQQIYVGGQLHSAHRLAFLYMTGSWPEKHIDHINGFAGDNRWDNLREVTPKENAKNRRCKESRPFLKDNNPKIQKALRNYGYGNVAKELDVSHQTVMNWANYGHVPYKRIVQVAGLLGMHPREIRPDLAKLIQGPETAVE